MIPQAFTTRDMTEAYNWLQTLPPQVREQMQTMEQVVSTYLKAKRLGVQPQAPNPTLAAPTELPQAPISAPPQATKSAQDFKANLKTLQTELEQFDFAPPPATAPAPAKPALAPPSSEIKIDARSRQILNEIRETLNLSSDIEVIRMSLVLARRVLKDIV